MKLTQIRHLVAVAARASLQSSAVDLGVSPQALIRSIRDLERELGTALFKRGRKAMTLTPVGEIFVQRAAAAQRELDRASREISRHPATPTARVTIGLSADAIASILPKVLLPFQMRFSDVRLRIVEGAFATMERQLRDGVLDFYVGALPPDHPANELRIDRLYDAAWIVVGRTGHPLAHATSFAQLGGARWIATSQSQLDALFERYRLAPPSITVEVDTGLGMLAAVAASDALAVLSARWTSFIERTDWLAAFAVDAHADASSICIVSRTQLPLTPATTYLHDLIVRSSRGMQPLPREQCSEPIGTRTDRKT